MKYLIILFLSQLFANESNLPRQRTRDRIVDIHHVKIDVTIDMMSESVYGHVIHTLSPFSSSLDFFELDASDMNIKRVRIRNKDILFNHVGDKLSISLNNPISWKDTINVRIDYTAYPRKGVYFVKPDDFYPEKPHQAWTQGEDTDNHHWVPLYDYPNERSTFETILTVKKIYKAVSNGELLSTIENDDGTHTWHWKENFPMVPYLISFVVGDYVKIEDKYNKTPVNYWVYKSNQKEASRSFGLTTDMMSFFGKETGIEYPYEKYDQIIVDDFMFGGMENITLTHNTDRTMYDEFASPDVSSEGLVAHELAHQWFGNMITTRNWANAWLNEGFATYYSRKYYEYKYGYNEGEYIRYSEMNSYFSSNKRWNRATVQNHFIESMDLFDGHIYAKGSLILNMINDYLGQDSFSKGIQHYVEENQHKNVETSDLKKAFEEVTGKNLDWFFKQWVYEPGFPEYEVSYSYNQRNRTVKLNVDQVQDLKNNSLFRMPIDIQIDEKIHTIMVEDQNLVYELPVQKRPKLIVFNSGMKVPCKVNFSKSLSEWILQLEKAPHILDRIAAVNVLKQKKGRRKVENALLNSAKNDEFWGVRKEAIKGFAKLNAKMYADELMDLSNGQDNRVKREIWKALKKYKNNQEVSIFLQNVIITDTKYYSISDAFRSLISVDTLAAGKKVLSLLQTNSHNDVIRKAAISYYGSVISDSNYDKLKNLCLYGGTTWDARPEAVYQLSKYVKTKPEALKTFIDLLEDPSRSVRKNCIRTLGKYGSKEHFGYLDEVLYNDPILSRDIRLAKKTINKEKNLINDKNDEVEKLNLKFEEIRKIIN